MAQSVDHLSVFSGTWEWRSAGSSATNDYFFGLYLRAEENTQTGKYATISGQYTCKLKGKTIINTLEQSKKGVLQGTSTDGKILVITFHDPVSKKEVVAHFKIIHKEKNLATWTLITPKSAKDLSVPASATLKKMRSMPKY